MMNKTIHILEIFCIADRLNLQSATGFILLPKCPFLTDVMCYPTGDNEFSIITPWNPFAFGDRHIIIALAATHSNHGILIVSNLS